MSDRKGKWNSRRKERLEQRERRVWRADFPALWEQARKAAPPPNGNPVGGHRAYT